MVIGSKIIELFCIVDDLCKFFDTMMVKYTLKHVIKRKYHREYTMYKAELCLL